MTSNVAAATYDWRLGPNAAHAEGSVPEFGRSTVMLTPGDDPSGSLIGVVRERPWWLDWVPGSMGAIAFDLQTNEPFNVSDTVYINVGHTCFGLGASAGGVLLVSRSFSPGDPTEWRIGHLRRIGRAAGVRKRRRRRRTPNTPTVASLATDAKGFSGLSDGQLASLFPGKVARETYQRWRAGVAERPTPANLARLNMLRDLFAELHERVSQPRTWLLTGSPSPYERLLDGRLEEVENLAAQIRGPVDADTAGLDAEGYSVARRPLRAPYDHSPSAEAPPPDEDGDWIVADEDPRDDED